MSVTASGVPTLENASKSSKMPTALGGPAKAAAPAQRLTRLQKLAKKAAAAGFFLRSDSKYASKAELMAKSGTYIDKRNTTTLDKGSKLIRATAGYTPSADWDWRVQRPECVGTATVRNQVTTRVKDAHGKLRMCVCVCVCERVCMRVL